MTVFQYRRFLAQVQRYLTRGDMTPAEAQMAISWADRQVLRYIRALILGSSDLS